MDVAQLVQEVPAMIMTDTEPAIQTNAPITQNVQTSGGSKRIKKTIKRTYTLGKSKIHKKVGILIKDKNTRKRVLNAQRDIKRHGINDIKQYLRTHGLMKAGSSAPNDIIRKIYESAMLSGEVTNQDKDILLQNFLKEKDE
jgi:repressor of nif and glnA expression